MSRNQTSIEPSVMIKQAVILVGGRGTRLGDLTQNTPKPLLEIAPNFRFLDVIISELARHGFSDILLLAGYCGEQVTALYQDKKVKDSTVRVFIEDTPLGTAGALATVKHELDPWFLMCNGDSFFDINLRDLTMNCRSGGTPGIALRRVEDSARFGSVDIEDGRITAFNEKTNSREEPGLINGGIYILNQSILGMIDGECSIEKDIFPQLVKDGRLRGFAYEGYFIDMGLPDTYKTAKLELVKKLQRPCIFFDRDGTLTEDNGYTYKTDDLVWIDGAKDAIKRFNDEGYLVIVVTNQSGIGRGYYTEGDAQKFHAAMSEQLAACGAHIDDFYLCPYHSEAKLPHYRVEDHEDRKPNPGMVLKALKDWSILKSKSLMVGDKDSDVECAEKVGVKGVKYLGGNLDDLICAHIDL